MLKRGGRKLPKRDPEERNRQNYQCSQYKEPSEVVRGLWRSGNASGNATVDDTRDVRRRRGSFILAGRRFLGYGVLFCLLLLFHVSYDKISTFGMLNFRARKALLSTRGPEEIFEPLRATFTSILQGK